MREQYEKLYYACCELPGFEEEAHFVAMKGDISDKSVRLMLVGRAGNGWEVDDGRTVSAAAYGEKAVEEFNDIDRWGWIHETNGGLYNHTENYCVSSAPFWNYSKAIYEALKNSPCEGIWMNNIIWSNLYKISPLEGGNPSKKYQEAELDACKDILKAEMEDARPTHILMMTGYDWFEPFSDIFSNVNYIGSNISRGNNKNEIYVEGTAEYKETKVVIMCRPEYREKENYVKAGVEAFR